MMSVESTAFDSVLDPYHLQHRRLSEDVPIEVGRSVYLVHRPEGAGFRLSEYDPEATVVEEIAGTLR